MKAQTFIYGSFSRNVYHCVTWYRKNKTLDIFILFAEIYTQIGAESKNVINLRRSHMPFAVLNKVFICLIRNKDTKGYTKALL